MVITQQAKLSVAIVGAGIGGSSCAAFLNDSFGGNIEIDIYEENEIGGRLAIAGNKIIGFELGGSIIHSKNKYMSDFVENFGLEKVKSTDEQRFGIFNGKYFEFISAGWQITNIFRMFWRYGLSLYKMLRFVSNMLTSFDRIYKIQSEGKAFETVDDLLYAIDPIFVRYANMSTYDCLKENAKLSELVIRELAESAMRVNYGQSVVQAHAFVGSVSLAGSTGSLWSVKGGNYQVAEHCVQYSKATFYNRQVVQIIRNDDDRKLLVISVKNEELMKKHYNVVIIAAPLAENTDNNIKFENFQKPIKFQGKYHQTVSTIVKGKLKGEFFNLNDQTIKNLEEIFNIGNGFFNSVGVCKSCVRSKLCKDLENVDKCNKNWKIFSSTILDDEKIEKLIDKTQIIKIKSWLAYPNYNDLGRTALSNFVLDDDLYYINAVEWAASAMEMSVIGAKNVALLIRNKYVCNLGLK